MAYPLCYTLTCFPDTNTLTTYRLPPEIPKQKDKTMNEENPKSIPEESFEYDMILASHSGNKARRLRCALKMRERQRWCAKQSSAELTE